MDDRLKLTLLRTLAVHAGEKPDPVSGAYAVSLGHHRSLIFYLPTADLLQTSFPLTPAQEISYRQFAGNGIFRLSVGIEDPDDLCRDLEQALSFVT